MGFSGRFRPLSGNKVSERFPIHPKLSTHYRFRPLSGNKVSEHEQVHNYFSQRSFRPLSGNKVSELYILCHPRHDILYIVFEVSPVSDTPLITTLYYTINA